MVLGAKKAGGLSVARSLMVSSSYRSGSVLVRIVAAVPAIRTPAAAPPVTVISIAVVPVVPVAERVPVPSVPAASPAAGLLDRADGPDCAADAIRVAERHGAGSTGHHRAAGKHCRRGRQGENTLAHESPPICFAVYVANSVLDHHVPLQRIMALRQNFAVPRISERALGMLGRDFRRFSDLPRKTAVSGLFAGAPPAVWRIQRRS